METMRRDRTQQQVGVTSQDGRDALVRSMRSAAATDSNTSEKHKERKPQQLVETFGFKTVERTPLHSASQGHCDPLRQTVTERPLCPVLHLPPPKRDSTINTSQTVGLQPHTGQTYGALC